jgi:hypothetical protein
MTLNTRTIIRATERMLTLAKRAAVSEDRDTRRAELVAVFSRLATDMGKVITAFRAVNWENVGLQTAIHALHTEAVQADERRCGTFTHLGSETAVLTNLHALAATLGFILSDADNLTPEDEQSRRYAEGHMQEARHAAE